MHPAAGPPCEPRRGAAMPVTQTKRGVVRAWGGGAVIPRRGWRCAPQHRPGPRGAVSGHSPGSGTARQARTISAPG